MLFNYFLLSSWTGFLPAPKPKSDIVDVVYSENAPKDYKISDKAQKQYGLLMDILELCDIYY